MDSGRRQSVSNHGGGLGLGCPLVCGHPEEALAVPGRAAGTGEGLEEMSV